MNRINALTGELITLTQIKRLLNQSIPATADLSEQGFPFVIDDLQPEVTAAQTATLGEPYQDHGVWRRSWTVVSTRENLVCDAWQGRSILRMTPPMTAGPLAAMPGTDLMAQVDAFVEANLSALALEKFRGAKTWRRNDPLLAQLAGLAGLDDEAMDAWFIAAQNIA